MNDRALDVGALTRAARDLGVPLDDRQLALFERYAALLVAANQHLNLTRLVDPRQIALGHFADSLACLALVEPRPSGAAHPLSCADLGSGAGLPGLALKIARPDWRLTLIEATLKKADHLQRTAAALQLQAVEVLPLRAEAVGHLPAHREAHDLVVARAVAVLPALVEYALPLLCLGGRLVALKGREAASEAVAAGPALARLGGRLAEVRPYVVSGLPGQRHVIAVEKVRATPAGFPRRPGVPARKPLARPSGG